MSGGRCTSAPWNVSKQLQEITRSWPDTRTSMLKPGFPRLLAVGVSVIAMAVAVPAWVAGQRGLQEGEWRAYAGDSYSQKYSPLRQNTKENIQDLRGVWRWAVPHRETGRGNP